MSRRAASAERCMIRGTARLLCLTAVVTGFSVATGASSAAAHGNPSTWAQLSYVGDYTWKISSRYMTGSPDHYKLVTRVCLQSRIPGGRPGPTCTMETGPAASAPWLTTGPPPMRRGRSQCVRRTAIPTGQSPVAGPLPAAAPSAIVAGTSRKSRPEPAKPESTDPVGLGWREAVWASGRCSIERARRGSVFVVCA